MTKRKQTAEEKAARAEKRRNVIAELESLTAKIRADMDLKKQPYVRPPLDDLKRAMNPPVTIR